MIRHGKGQLNDDDIRQTLAGYIDTLPEAVGAEQDTAGILLELVQQTSPVDTAALGQQFHTLICQPVGKHLRGGFEHGIAGKQYKRFPAAFEQIFLDSFAGGVDKAGVIRVGHVRLDIHPHLVFIIKRRAGLQGVVFFQADTSGEKIEPFFVIPAATKRGTCQDDRIKRIKQHGFQVRADIQRRRAKHDTFITVLLDLDPVHAAVAQTFSNRFPTRPICPHSDPARICHLHRGSI